MFLQENAMQTVRVMVSMVFVCYQPMTTANTVTSKASNVNQVYLNIQMYITNEDLPIRL